MNLQSKETIKAISFVVSRVQKREFLFHRSYCRLDSHTSDEHLMTQKIVNGLNVQEVQALIEAVKKEPGIAQARFHTSTNWITGFQNQASIKDFTLGGVTNSTSRTKPFTVVGDHPQELLGTNKGPSSVELLLAALGHCIGSGFSTYGAHMGIPIVSLVVEIQGDVDLQGMLALPEPGKVRPGFQKIMAKYYVQSEAPREQLQQLGKLAEDLSPTRDSLRAVPFSSELVVK